ncbi:hypothetical protein F6476_24760 [Pseudomonas umsongensis]|nr:hypothetical protein F6476_24760 [Pseudomonas umsongensis]
MVVNDNAGSLKPLGGLRFFASSRASTGCSHNLQPRVVRRRWRGSNCRLRRRSILAPFYL